MTFKSVNIKHFIIATIALALSLGASAQNNIAEEVAWVIGDTPIWKSEIEEQIQNYRYENRDIKGDPYCFIPEQMAIEKLFLHQADIDTINANENMAVSQADSQINYLISQLGSKEKVEQYFHKSIPELRRGYIEMIGNQSRVQEVQKALTKDVSATPNDVRRYFDRLPADSIPFVPLQVDVQIITFNPAVPRDEIEDVKSRLRSYAEEINKGQSDMSTLAILYSEDPGSSVRGGETGFMNRSSLDPEFAAVAFNLNDTKKVSRIVQSQFGYHIIQLIEKRGDRINVRHILLRPKVSQADLDQALERLDSVRSDIMAEKFPFEQAALYLSQDKDTKNNKGIMVNQETGNSHFEMSQLPQEVAKVVAPLQPGDVSKPFVMIDPKLNREVVAIVKLTDRVAGHQANMRNDYQLIKTMYENSKREQIIANWLEKKIAETYVRIEPAWRNCDFRYKGWVKERQGNQALKEAEENENK
ncbi:MAG: peptidylprolyl isomerase [Muribaculaceae bacterium]|nr:peptidylprolyl isomerase [Muribaculaceae bacterium]